MIINDQNGRAINIKDFEKDEQALAAKYIEENDVVFELGARYGSVSCVINSKLKCKTNQVSVEPDYRVWGALENNKRDNNCNFHIVKGFVSVNKLNISNIDTFYGYGTTSIKDDNSNIPSFTMQEINEQYGLKFNVLVADCEGFLETFFDENPEFYDNLRLIMFEADYPDKCNYDKIRDTLKERGFTNLLHGFQNVWVRNI